jgi:hypothetical protein
VEHSASGHDEAAQHRVTTDLTPMTRMLTAVFAVLVLSAAAVQAASANSSSHGGSPPHEPPNSTGAVVEATAIAQASGDGSTATATATCPHGTRAAGGGFNAASSSEAIALVYESVKAGQHSWRASAQLLDPGNQSTLDLTTYVYCRKHFPVTRSTATTVPTDGQVQIGPTASASCPSGEIAMAGGFRMAAPLVSPTVTDLFFDSIRSGTSSWDARVVTGPAGPSAITSEAYCARNATALLESDGSSTPNAQDSVSSTATAACPNGTSPAAGGFAQPDSAVVSFFFVYESRRVGDGWQVSGLHSGADPGVALDSAAYCA